jgi:hypothetical protein
MFADRLSRLWHTSPTRLSDRPRVHPQLLLTEARGHAACRKRRSTAEAGGMEKECCRMPRPLFPRKMGVFKKCWRATFRPSSFALRCALRGLRFGPAQRTTRKPKPPKGHSYLGKEGDISILR